MSRNLEKLKEFLKTCTDEKMRESVKRRIDVLEKRETVYKDEEVSN